MSETQNYNEKVKYNEPGRKLKQSEIDFMKLIEKQNADRVMKLKKLKRNNLVTALSVGSAVMGIYLYSMFSVKQEKFLDDFNEPEMVPIEAADNKA